MSTTALPRADPAAAAGCAATTEHPAPDALDALRGILIGVLLSIPLWVGLVLTIRAAAS